MKRDFKFETLNGESMSNVRQRAILDVVLG